MSGRRLPAYLLYLGLLGWSTGCRQEPPRLIRDPELVRRVLAEVDSAATAKLLHHETESREIDISRAREALDLVNTHLLSARKTVTVLKKPFRPYRCSLVGSVQQLQRHIREQFDLYAEDPEKQSNDYIDVLVERLSEIKPFRRDAHRQLAAYTQRVRHEYAYPVLMRSHPVVNQHAAECKRATEQLVNHLEAQFSIAARDIQQYRSP